MKLTIYNYECNLNYFSAKLLLYFIVYNYQCKLHHLRVYFHLNTLLKTKSLNYITIMWRFFNFTLDNWECKADYTFLLHAKILPFNFTFSFLSVTTSPWILPHTSFPLPSPHAIYHLTLTSYHSFSPSLFLLFVLSLPTIFIH